jgi:hypothetical protein
MSLDQFLSVVTTVTVVIGALVACRGINSWRNEMVGRRRAEIAEETLALFYEAQRILEHARMPLTFEGEGKTRPRKPSEEDPSSTTSYLDSLFVPVERTNKFAEFWGKFDSQKYRFRALFGSEQPFLDLAATRNTVVFSAHRLIEMHRERYDGDSMTPDRKRLKIQWEEAIGWTLGERDEKKAEIKRAVVEIEKICRPAIDGFYAPHRDWLSRLLG